MPNNLLKRIYSYLFFSVITLSVISQTNTQSPYSRFGLGEPVFRGAFANDMMGGTAQGFSSPFYINLANPASFSKNTLTNLEAGFYTKFGELSDSASKSGYKNFEFSYIALAFPLSQKKKWGASFGLLPETYSGYNVSVRNTSAPSPRIDLYKGTGGLNRAYLGSGFNITKDIAVGANFNYVFGNIKTYRQNVYDSLTVRDYEYTRSQSVSGINFDIGTQVSHSFKHRHYEYQRDSLKNFIRDSLDHKIKIFSADTNDMDSTVFCFGATYTLPSKLNANRDIFAATFKGFDFTGSPLSVDTILFTEREKGKVVYPSGIAVGFMVSKPFHYSYGADLNYRSWSKLTYFGTNDSLKNSFTISAGGSFIPDYNDDNKYFKRVEYRGGVRYSQTPYYFSGQQLKSISVNLGASLPVKNGKLNLGVELGTMGTTEFNLVKDNFVKVSLGLSLYDRWFRHTKIQ